MTTLLLLSLLWVLIAVVARASGQLAAKVLKRLLFGLLRRGRRHRLM